MVAMVVVIGNDGSRCGDSDGDTGGDRGGGW